MEDKIKDRKTKLIDTCIEFGNNNLNYGENKNLTSPLITILVITTKKTKYFDEHIKALLNQWHVDFFWNIVIVENGYNENENNTRIESLKNISNDRILYFSNQNEIPYIECLMKMINTLVKGKWVLIIRACDILTPNALISIKRAIDICNINCDILGGFVLNFEKFAYITKANSYNPNIAELSNFLSSLSMDENIYEFNTLDMLFRGIICDPNGINGAGLLFNRNICSLIDAIPGNFSELLYKLNKISKVILLQLPVGYYRLSDSIKKQKKMLINYEKEVKAFNDYVYFDDKKFRIIGILFGSCQVKWTIENHIKELNNIYDDTKTMYFTLRKHNVSTNNFYYILYVKLLLKFYNFHKKIQSKRFEKKAKKYKKDE